ncbi:MAG: hypothetical protein HY246_20850 [Proteobacteria bacterium]|nr:hypothetical protein [Pseudomonadota bacterium]
MRPKKRPAELLFAANLPFSVTDEQLGILFDPFGIVISSRVARDPKTGHSRGFGFVELATERARAAAVAALNGAAFEGRKIEVRPAHQPIEPAARPRLRVASPAVAPAPRRSVVVEYRKLSERRLSGAS